MRGNGGVASMALADIAKQYGLFVALVCWILWYFDKLIKQMRVDNAKRESRYIGIIDKLSESFLELKRDVEEIKHWLRDNKTKGGDNP